MNKNRQNLYYIEGVTYLYPRFQGAYKDGSEMDRPFKYIATETKITETGEPAFKVLYSIHEGKAYDVSNSNLVLHGTEHNRVYLSVTKKPEYMSTEEFLSKLIYNKNTKSKIK